MSEEAVRDAFRQQATWCERLGSPFTARLLAVVEQVLDRSTVLGRHILDWNGDPYAKGDAMPLRLAGGLHALARSGRSPELAAIYPPTGDTSDTIVGVIADTLGRYGDVLDPWLESAPQTNEVARSAILYPGLMEIASIARLPIALYEIGSSAGLNLVLDRYLYNLGTRTVGDLRSPVHLAPAWSGPAPGGSEPIIASRCGCDLAPVDLSMEAGCERLIAYVWPDQTERLKRISAAIDITRLDPPRIDRSDAAEWVEFSIRPTEGVTTVLMHSIMFGYLPDETQRRIGRHMEAVGAFSSAEAPLAWLAFEMSSAGPAALTMRLWPDGQHRTLARADAHCREVTWLGAG